MHSTSAKYNTENTHILRLQLRGPKLLTLLLRIGNGQPSSSSLQNSLVRQTFTVEYAKHRGSQSVPHRSGNL